MLFRGILLSLIALIALQAPAAGVCNKLFSTPAQWVGALAQKPRIIILSAPSGGGKTTLMKKLFDEYPNNFKLAISTTTRAPRGTEVNGVDYHFISVAEFKARMAAGDFVESAEVHGNFYGTSKSEIDAILKTGKNVILDKNVDGAATLRLAIPGVLSLFISPPNMKILEERLRGRGTDAEEVIQKRLKNAASEMARQNEYDGTVVNDNLDVAYADLKKFLQSIP